MNCRHCEQPLTHQLVDLGFAPPSNAYLTDDDLARAEVTLPLRVMVCAHCWLVQTADYATAESLFTKEYAYFSSTSVSWCQHATKYCNQAIDQFHLDENSFVVEVASNDGYLLKNFVQKGIPCLGIEPTASTAAAAEAQGIPVVREFFEEALARELIAIHGKASLICGNNVYAHVPDINGFTRALALMLSDDGTITLEFPHVLQLLRYNQFDTIYHEHFSYLSLTSVSRIFAASGLRVFDVERLGTHGGSLRVYGCHESDVRPDSERVTDLIEHELQFGLQTVERYTSLQMNANLVKDHFVSFLLTQKADGKVVAGYGAAAKGNTLLNYGGVKPDLIPFVCDASEAKQGMYLPGSHIPILPPSALVEYKPDFVVIFPWNIAPEVQVQQSVVKSWGGKFVVAVPDLDVLE